MPNIDKSQLSSYIIQEETSVIDAAAVIDATGKQIVFICDGMKLLATFSDGDLRRYVLRSGDLSGPVREAANYNPTKLLTGEQHAVHEIEKRNPYVRGVPVVDTQGNIVSIYFTDNITVKRKAQLAIPVVIMAGGKGTRLAPYTNVLPKPLIPVSDKTITEHIMDKFLDFGCKDFTMIVNHRKELIKAYFNETPCPGNLRFIDEAEFLGTGGGLKLLEGKVNSTFFVTNCDILIEADYEDILRHHRTGGALLTMVCALKKISVPYGTVELDEGGKLSGITEKPEFPILTNTGLYVVEPGFLDIISHNESVDITELIQRVKDSGKTVGVYPVAEADWMDMGRLEEHAKMSQHFSALTP